MTSTNMKSDCTAIVLFWLCWIIKVVKSMDIIEPPSGTCISAIADAANVTTLECNIFTDGMKEVVEWRLVGHTSRNLNGDTRFRFQNANNFITIVRFDRDLHGQNLVCRTGRRGEVASYPLTVFEPPGRIPTLTIAQRGDTWISVSWQAPGNLGNPPISNYQVSLTSMGNISRETKVVTVNATAGDARISHLLPGVSYTVSVLSLTTLTSSVEEGEANTTMVDTLPPQDYVQLIVMLNLSFQCNWTQTNESIHDEVLADAVNSTHLEIQSACDCSYRREYIYDRELSCPCDPPFNSNSATFCARLLVEQVTREDLQAYTARKQHGRGEQPLTSDYRIAGTKGSESPSFNNIHMTYTTESAKASSMPAALLVPVIVVAVVAVAGVFLTVTFVTLFLLKRRRIKKAVLTEAVGQKEPRLEFQDCENNQYQDPHLLSKKQTGEGSDTKEKSLSSLKTSEKEQTDCLPTSKDDACSTGTGWSDIVPYESLQVVMKDANKNLKQSATNASATDGSSSTSNPCDTGKASRKPKAKTKLQPTLPEMSGIELDLDDAADTPTKTSSAVNNIPASSKAEERNVSEDLGMCASIETTLDMPKKGKKKKSASVVVKTEGKGSLDNNPSTSDAIYTAVMTRGKSLKARPVPKGSGSEVKDVPNSLSGWSNKLDRMKEAEDDRFSPPPPLPPETDAKYTTPETHSLENTSLQAPNTGDHAHKYLGKLQGKSNDLSNNKEETVRKEKTGNELGKDTEDDCKLATPVLPPETSVQHVTPEGVESENLYAECIPTIKPSSSTAPEPLTMKDILGAKKSAKKLKGKTASKSTTPLGEMRLATPPAISLLATPHTITAPIGSFPNNNTPDGDHHSPDKRNTLRPKSSKKNDKDDRDTGNDPTNGQSRSLSSSHTLSLTNLVEMDEGDSSKSKLKKGKSSKFIRLLVKKPITKDDKSPSPKKEKSKPSSSDKPGSAIGGTARVPGELTSPELIYDEVNTNIRSAIGKNVPPPTHAAPQPKCPLVSKEFPTISELENEAARKISLSDEVSQYEVMTLNPQRRKPSHEHAGTPVNDISMTRQLGKVGEAQEEVMYEVMTNLSKAPPTPKATKKTEEQVYETMMSSKAVRKASAPTMDQEYEVMASIRPRQK